MKLKKFTIALLGLILLLSLIGSASASNSYITAQFTPNTANVGDTVTLTVDAYNEGWYGQIFDAYPVVVSIQHTSGLEILSFVAYDKVLQNYDESTGIWDVNRMRHDERGKWKELIITYKVLPSAAGKQLTATAKFKQFTEEGSFPSIDLASSIKSSKDTLTISNRDNKTDDTGTGTGTGNGNGNGNGTGSGNGNGNGNGNSLIDASGNSKLASAIGNLTSSNKNSPLKNLQGGGGGGSGKAYEVTTTPQKTNPDYLYILVALLLIGLILAGYFYGVRRE